MFSGYGGEILYRPYHRNFGIGFEVWEAYQSYNQMFDLRNYKTLTGHLNLFYHEPELTSYSTSRVAMSSKGFRIYI